jgi:hypothetical protein
MDGASGLVQTALWETEATSPNLSRARSFLKQEIPAEAQLVLGAETAGNIPGSKPVVQLEKRADLGIPFPACVKEAVGYADLKWPAYHPTGIERIEDLIAFNISRNRHEVT